MITLSQRRDTVIPFKTGFLSNNIRVQQSVPHRKQIRHQLQRRTGQCLWRQSLFDLKTIPNTQIHSVGRTKWVCIYIYVYNLLQRTKHFVLPIESICVFRLVLKYIYIYIYIYYLFIYNSHWTLKGYRINRFDRSVIREFTIWNLCSETYCSEIILPFLSFSK
jgi:hypothetical protein